MVVPVKVEAPETESVLAVTLPSKVELVMIELEMCERSTELAVLPPLLPPLDELLLGSASMRAERLLNMESTYEVTKSVEAP